MKLKYILYLALIITYGCSEKEVNPCDLLTLEEVRKVAPDAQANEYHPASTSKSKDNELCLWHNGGDRNVFMLFYYSSSNVSPQELIESAMPDGSRIIEVSNVGDTAAAGFIDDEVNSASSLKMFSAQSKNNMIGIRVQGVSDENGDNFLTLKDIANKALARI